MAKAKRNYSAILSERGNAPSKEQIQDLSYRDKWEPTPTFEKAFESQTTTHAPSKLSFGDFKAAEQELERRKQERGTALKSDAVTSNTFVPEEKTKQIEFRNARDSIQGNDAGISIGTNLKPSVSAINVNNMPQLDTTARQTIIAKQAQEENEKPTFVQRVKSAIKGDAPIFKGSSPSLARMPFVGEYATATPEERQFADSVQAPDHETTLLPSNQAPQHMVMRGGIESNFQNKYGPKDIKITAPSHKKIIPKDVDTANLYMTEVYGKDWVNRDSHKPFKLSKADNTIIAIADLQAEPVSNPVEAFAREYAIGKITFDGLGEVGYDMANATKDEWNNPKNEAKSEYNKYMYALNNFENLKSGNISKDMTNPIFRFVTEGIGGIGQQAALYLNAIPDAAVGGALGIAAANPVAGAKVGFTYSMYKSEKGMAYLQYREAGMPHEQAQLASDAAGMVNAGLEYLELELLMKGVKADKVSKMILDKIPSDVLKNSISVLGKQATVTGAEILQEGVQQFVTNLGQNVGFDQANKKYGTDFEIMPPKQLAQETWEEMKAVTPTMVMMGFFGLPANIKNVRTEEFNAKVGEKAVSAIDDLQTLKDNPQMQVEAPHQYQQLVHNVASYQYFLNQAVTNNLLDEKNAQRYTQVSDMANEILGSQMQPVNNKTIARESFSGVNVDGDMIEFHKSSMGKNLGDERLNKINNAITVLSNVGNIDFDIVKVDTKSGNIHFIKTDDFDGKEEPEVTSVTTISNNGNIDVSTPSNRVIKNKAKYLPDDYQPQIVQQSPSQATNEEVSEVQPAENTTPQEVPEEITPQPIEENQAPVAEKKEEPIQTQEQPQENGDVTPKDIPQEKPQAEETSTVSKKEEVQEEIDEETEEETDEELDSGVVNSDSKSRQNGDVVNTSTYGEVKIVDDSDKSTITIQPKGGNEITIGRNAFEKMIINSKEEKAPVEKVVDKEPTKEETKTKSADERLDIIPEYVQRIEEPGVKRATVDKPHGIYTSPGNIESPHKDLKGVTFYWETNKDSNILKIKVDMFRTNRGKVGESAGIGAIRKFVGDDEVSRMLGTSKAELVQELSQTYPQVEWNKYYDQQEMLEGLAGLKARELGYDAIWAVDADEETLDEFVALTPNAVNEIDKPKTEPPEQEKNPSEEIQANVEEKGETVSKEPKNDKAETQDNILSDIKAIIGNDLFKDNEETFENAIAEILKNPSDIDKAYYSILNVLKDISMDDSSQILAENKEILKHLRNTKLKITNELRSIADFDAFRRKYFGKLRLSKEGTAMDNFYMELSELYPQYFHDNITHPSDQLMQIVHIIDTLNKTTTQKLSDIMSDLEITEHYIAPILEAIHKNVDGGIANESTTEANTKQSKSTQDDRPGETIQSNTERTGENGKAQKENKPEVKEKGEKENETKVQGISEGVSGGTESGVLQRTGGKGDTGKLSGQTERMGDGNTQENENSGNGKGNEQADIPRGSTSSDASKPSGDASGGNSENDARRTSDESTEGYTIEDLDHDKGTRVQRYNNNIAAIKLLQTLQSENRKATAEEKEVLSKYSGWGGLKEPFVDNKEKTWQNRANEIKELLSKEQYRAAATSTENAFYTPIPVINSMYSMIKKLGISNKCKMVEPSCGSGHFLGAMPASMKNSAQIMGIELDDITGNIAKYLYPNADIKVQGFEKTNIPKGSMDLVIGNIPFGKLDAPYDSEYKQYKKYKIHDYFILKSLDSLKDGGIMAVITTSGSLDKSSKEVRELMAGKANLVAAIRLPKETFNATDVISDILIMQKKGENVNDNGIKFTETKKLNGFEVNEYFAEHPEMILGDMQKTINQFGQEVMTVIANDKTIDDVMQYIPKSIISKQVQTKAEEETEATNKTVFEDVDNGEDAFIVKDGKVLKRNPDTNAMEEWHKIYKTGAKKGKKEILTLGSTSGKRLTGMMRIAREFQNVIDVQTKSDDPKKLKAAQTKLSIIYDDFVKRYGSIHSSTNTNLFDDDNRYYAISSLEEKVYEGENVKYVKSNTFTERVVPKYEPVTSADSAIDALTLSLNNAGGIDLDYMMDLYGKSKEEIIAELGNSIYKLPNSADDYVIAEEYLSGNVRKKLKEAKKAAKSDPSYQKNVDALEKVQPSRLTADQISVNLGSPWVGTKYTADFISSLYGGADATVHYNDFNARWTVDVKPSISQNEIATTRWGVEGYTPIEMVNAILNKKPIQVTYKDQHGNNQVDQVRTDMAIAKADEIKEHFVSWIYQDAERRRSLEDYYNENVNNLVTRIFDGLYLRMPGLSPNVSLRPLQLSGIARAVNSVRNVLFAYPVGAGKTYTMIGAVHELKRLGMAQKPLMVVPNQKLGDFMGDFYKMYPNAKILTITGKDFSATNRKRLLAKIKNTNYDCVIMRKSSFSMFPFSPEYEQEYLQKQIDELEESIRESKETMSKRDLSNMVQKLENLKSKLEEAMYQPKDAAGIYLDTCGVDALIVDEAHNYKNLDFNTKMTRMSGVNSQGGPTARHMHMATEMMNTRKNKIIFATATPISNTMGEAYTMMRYLQPDTLEDYGIKSFDAFADTYGQVIQSTEPNTTGSGIVTKERFAKFKNVPELIKIFKITADIIKKSDIDLKLPNAEIKSIMIENNTILKKFNQKIEQKKNAMKGKPEKGGENHLTLMADARNGSLDLRLVRDQLIRDGIIPPSMSFEALDLPDSKVNTTINNIYQEYVDSTENKGTQVVFLDQGVPGGDGFNLYEDIRTKLIAKGIKPGEIAFIQDTAGTNSDEKKTRLFDKVNAGQVRILLGSTAMMGEGMNVQKKAVALHHIDPPKLMRPSDVEQRNGRVIRQKNENDNVRVYFYSTLESYDSPTWKMLSRKQKNFDQLLEGDESIREIDDLTEDLFADMSIEAANNPLMFERKDVEDAIKKLEAKRRNFVRMRSYNQDTVANYPKKKKTFEDTHKKLAEALSKVKAAPEKSYIVNGVTYEKMSEASDALKEFFKEMKEKVEFVEAGSIRGLPLKIKKLNNYEYEVLAEGIKDGIDDKLEKAVLSEEEGGYNDSNYPTSSVFVRLNNKIKNIEPNIERYKNILEEYKKEYEAAKDFDAEFAEESELTELKARLKEIDKLLQKRSEAAAKGEPAEQAEKTQELVASDLMGQFYQPKHPDLYKDAVKFHVSDKKKIKPISTIIKEIGINFEIPITSKRFYGKKGVMGRYNTVRGFIETRHDNMIEVVAHELGHHFDEVYSITDNNKAHLRIMSKKLNPRVKDKYKEEDLPSETLAEFVRLYLVNPNGAYELGVLDNVNFYDTFEKSLSPKDLAKLKSTRADVLQWLGADTSDQIKSTIKYRTKKGSKVKSTFEEKRTKMYIEWVNEYESFKIMNDKIEEATGKKVSASDNAEFLAYQSQRSNVITSRIVLNNLIDNEGHILGKSFSKITKAINPKEMTDFDAYLKVVHSIDWMDNGKMVFSPSFTREMLVTQKEYYEEQFPHFKDVAEEIYVWWDTFTRNWLVKTGFMEQEVYEKMHSMYPHYVPNFRADDEFFNTGGAKPGFSNQRNPVRSASKEGSSKDTYSAIENMLIEIDRYVKSVQRREVMLALHRNYNKQGYEEVMGDFMRKVRPEVQRHVYDAKGLKVAVENEIFNREIDQLSPEYRAEFDGLDAENKLDYLKDKGIDITMDGVIEDYITYYTPKQISTDKSIVTVRNNGKVYFYEVFDKYMAQALTNLGSKELDGVLKIMSEIRRTFTVLTTGGNVLFGLTSNIFRDIPQAFIMGKYINPVSFAAGMAKAVKHVITKDETYKLYKNLGGGFESSVGADFNYMDKVMDKMFNVWDIKRPWREIVGGIEGINNLIEIVPRMVEFDKILSTGNGSYDNMLEAIHGASDVTLNFQRRGSGKALTQLAAVIPFFNAGIQGIDKTYRGLTNKETRGKTILKSLMLITTFAIAQALVYSDDDDYDKLPDYIRNNYWLIKYEPGKFIRIPKTRELGVLFGTTFETAIREMLHGEDDNGKALKMAFLDNFMLPVNWIFAPIEDVMANRTWSGGTLVSMKDQDYLQNGYYNDVYDDTTSQIAIVLAKLLPDTNALGIINTPKGIEYLIKQYTGGLGQIALPLTSKSGDGVSSVVSKKMTTDTAYSNRYVEEFYNAYAKLKAADKKYKDKGIQDENYNDELRKEFRRKADGLKDAPGMSQYWSEIRSINNDRSLTPDERISQTREVKQKINEIAEEMVKKYKGQETSSSSTSSSTVSVTDAEGNQIDYND